MKEKITNTILLPFLLISILILLALIDEKLNLNFDLTSDKKHTISDESIKIIKNIDDKVFIKVYLEGQFPSEFKKLSNSALNFLKLIRNYSPNLIDFEFINPNESNDNLELIKQLVKKGLLPTDLEIINDNSKVNQIIFPGAIMYYKDKHIAINFLENNVNKRPAENINSSIEEIEYKFITSILSLTNNKKKKIAFLEGNGELDNNRILDVTKSILKDNYNLNYYYNVEKFDIKKYSLDSISKEPSIEKQLDKIMQYTTIVIAKPSIPFNNLEKFLLDQYIMNGGKILWLIDGVKANMDSLQFNNGSFIATQNNLNLNDQLFKYGARINYNIIEDLRATKIPIITGYSNNLPQQEFFTWPYFPLLNSNSKHPISRNLDAIKCNFASSIDTIQNNIKKTILLKSSKKTRTISAPVKISLNMLKNPPKLETYNKENQIIAVLLEGEFESVFKNRMLPKNQKISFIEKSKPTSMIIVSDADIIANDVSSNGNIYPLGYDKFIEYIYKGNKTFIINAVQHLCNSPNVNQLKSKKIKLRLLDKSITKSYRNLIQLLNIFVPLLFLLIIFYTKTTRNAKNF